MSLTQFFRIVWARRWVIFASTLACVAAAFLAIAILPPRYEAKTRLMLDIVKPDPVTGEVIASQWARAYVRTQIELIRDYRVAGGVADELGWTGSPQLAEAYRRSGEAHNMDFRRWLAQLVIDATKVDLIEGSNILEISYVSSSPDAAAKVADAIRDAYVKETRGMRQHSAESNARYFEDQRQRLRQELTAAEQRKADFERANGIVLTDDNVDADTARLQALAGTAQAPVSTAPSAPVMPASAGQLAQIDAAIAAASQTLGPNHPDLRKLREQRAVLSATVAKERGAAAASRSPGTSGPSIAQQYSAQQQKVLAQAGKVGEAKRLAADVALLRDQYNKVATRAAEFQQEAESNEAGLTLLGDAIAPPSPVFPKVPLIMFGALGFGLGLGLLVALLAELLNRRVRGADDLALSGVPMIGMMAQTSSPEPRRFFSWRKASA